MDLPGKPVELLEGDVILVATDGLLTLDEGQIAAAISKTAQADASALAAALLQAVTDAGSPKQDNTTVAVIARATEADSSRTRAPEKPMRLGTSGEDH